MPPPPHDADVGTTAILSVTILIKSEGIGCRHNVLNNNYVQIFFRDCVLSQETQSRGINRVVWEGGSQGSRLQSNDTILCNYHRFILYPIWCIARQNSCSVEVCLMQKLVHTFITFLFEICFHAKFMLFMLKQFRGSDRWPFPYFLYFCNFVRRLLFCWINSIPKARSQCRYWEICLLNKYYNR